MKTNKEMQIKILNKMIENIENDDGLLKDIQYKNRINLEWDDRVYDVNSNYFKSLEMRVKPETITINGVEIPKPLEKDDLLSMKSKEKVYSVSSSCHLYIEMYSYIALDQNYELVYRTKEEAIEASKLLFGLG